jgi:hypothetical protein
MSFNHLKVSRLESETQKYIDKAKSEVRTTNESDERYYAMVTRNVDGVHGVDVQTATFCEALRKELRGIKFGYSRSGAKTVWKGSNVVLQTLWAYYPGDEYALGLVGYADFAVSGTGDDKFAVYARGIKNEKFGEDHDQYYMAMSVDVTKAVKNAKKYLRRYGTPEVAMMSLSDFQHKLSSAMWTASSEHRSAKESFVNNLSFEMELEAIINSGYQFNNPVLGDVARDLIAKYKESVERQNQAHHGWYVLVRDFAGGQMFDVAEVLDMKRATVRNLGEIKAYTPEELPEDIGHKIAALSMLEGEAFVEGLGMRVSPTSYWVLQ